MRNARPSRMSCWRSGLKCRTVLPATTGDGRYPSGCFSRYSCQSNCNVTWRWRCSCSRRSAQSGRHRGDSGDDDGGEPKTALSTRSSSQPSGKGPTDPRGRRPLEVLSDRSLADGAAAGDLAPPQIQLIFQSKNFSDLVHRQSPVRQTESPFVGGGHSAILLSSATLLCPCENRSADSDHHSAGHRKVIGLPAEP